MEVVENLYNLNKRVIFLSNAPRPSHNVINFLKKLKMKEKYLKNVITSGEAAYLSIQKKKYGLNFFHLGPQRDQSIFRGLEKNKTNLSDCDYILCTGLFDEREKDLDYYYDLLKGHEDKKFVCTNPDLTVHRGDVEEYCAGSIAEIFEKIGGKVIYFGKPHKEIYKMFIKKNEKALAIGDNLKTDIKGANNLNIDSVFITNGIHINEFKTEEDLASLINHYKVKTKYFQEKLTW